MTDTFRPTSLSPEALEAWDAAEANIEASMQRIAALVAPARAALAQPEPVAPTGEELLEIRDGAYCPNVDEVNDEEDSMWQYTSDYISWLYDQGTIEEQQEYEAKGLRAVFNAGRRALEALPND